jgi:hypothetical protein
LKKPIKFLKIFNKNITYLKPEFWVKKEIDIQIDSKFKIKKHKSVLLRNLGGANIDLQRQKVKNL